MNWHPHTERPELDAPATGLIAVRADDGEVFVLGIYVWDGTEWIDEEIFDRAVPAEHWWMSEDELLKGLA